MPIHEYECRNCGKLYEEIVMPGQESPHCPHCGAGEGNRLMSAGSQYNGKEGPNTPGTRGHGCCGSNPGEKGCVPGSCCGKA